MVKNPLYLFHCPIKSYLPGLLSGQSRTSDVGFRCRSLWFTSKISCLSTGPWRQYDQISSDVDLDPWAYMGGQVQRVAQGVAGPAAQAVGLALLEAVVRWWGPLSKTEHALETTLNRLWRNPKEVNLALEKLWECGA